MKKGSKPPEERRKELVDTAARLFAEKGYESVSVRDILNEVSGAPGMFYECPSGSDKAMILMLGDAIDDRMAVSGVKWLHKQGCHAKFQGVEIVTDGGSKVKKDLLAPLK